MKLSSIVQLKCRIKISSICPHTDKHEAQAKVDELNRRLQDQATELKCDFINQDQNMRYRNNSVDKCILLLDGLHLPAAGMVRLIRNLGLPTVTKSKLTNQDKIGRHINRK